jgi:hypothetical protein
VWGARNVPSQQYTAIGAKSITNLYTVRALNPSPMASGIVGSRDFSPSANTSLENKPVLLPIRKEQSHTPGYKSASIWLQGGKQAFFCAALHSTHIKPLTKNTEGVKCFLWHTQCPRYFFCFSSSWLARRITLDSIPRCKGDSVSVTRISNIALVLQD